MTSLEEPKYNVLDIVRGTTVDGPGMRTSIYLSGCAHNCPSCHNPQSHNPNNGKIMTLGELLDIIKAEDFNVTLTGGDPLYNAEKTAILAKAIKNQGKSIWLYTGYTAEEILEDETLSASVSYVDTIVEGRFILEQKNPDLLFRGSENQRILDVIMTNGKISFIPHSFPSANPFI